MAKDYHIGRGKPPKSTQFKKGRSGNPNGRPKGSQNIAKIATRLLNVTAPMPFNGVTSKFTLRERTVLAQIEKAMRGSLKHFAYLRTLDLDQTERHGGEAIVIELDMGSPGDPRD